jgi:hypothetical protein
MNFMSHFNLKPPEKVRLKEPNKEGADLFDKNNFQSSSESILNSSVEVHTQNCEFLFKLCI